MLHQGFQELHRLLLHPNDEPVYPAAKVTIANQRRYRDSQARGSRNQCFGDPPGQHTRITDAVNGKAQAQNQLLQLIANHLVDASASDPFAQPLTEYDLKLLETYVSDVLDSKGDN